MNCATCKLVFEDINQHKAHYRTEYHDFNIRRKMVGLPPRSEVEFKDSLNRINLGNTTQTLAQGNLSCLVCHKFFKTKETLNNHLKSKRHIQQTELNKNEKIIIKEKHFVPIQSTTLYNQHICLFCNEVSSDIDQNLTHMQNQHSFFICEESNCIDKQQLLKCLADQIFNQLECIYCCYTKQKHRKHFQDVQQHMIDKSHCKMNQFFLKDFQSYYDYQEQNQKIIDEYIVQGTLGWESLKGFDLR